MTGAWLEIVFPGPQDVVVPSSAPQKVARSDLFNQGLWVEMVNDGQDAALGAKDVQMRDRCGPDLRATRAEKLAMAGELSAARKALENAVVAPGNLRTLRALTNPDRRLPRGLMSSRARPLFSVGRGEVRTKCAQGQTRCRAWTVWHDKRTLFPMLESEGDLDALTQLASLVARGEIPPRALEVFRLGRVTALQKPGGGIRGIVVGDVFRRVLARTIASKC